MEVFEFTDYKQAIRVRFKQVRSKRPGFTFKRIAARIPIQYTYFSRVMNQEHLHFSEDHLFSICGILELDASQTRYMLLLRSWITSNNSERQNYLLGQLEKERREQGGSVCASLIKAPQGMNNELKYLLDPVITLVLVALHIPQIRHNPRLLASQLGITLSRARQALEVLRDLSILDLDETGWEIQRLRRSRFHLGLDHPVTRIHQTLFKALSHSRFMEAEEGDKQSFLATFTMDSEGFEAVKREFSQFSKKIETIAAQGRHHGVYQVSFDLFKWL